MSLLSMSNLSQRARLAAMLAMALYMSRNARSAARPDGDETHSAAKLIRPEPNWPRAALNHAEAAADVAHWVIDLTGDQRLVSDAPAFDQHWLDRLPETAPGLPRPEIVDFDAVAGCRFCFPQEATVRHRRPASAPTRN